MWNFWVYYAAYTTDEIDEKTKALRASANLSVAEDAPAVEVSISWVLCPLKNWVASPFNYQNIYIYIYFIRIFYLSKKKKG